ncbi:MAG: molybdopterin-dependent oxidoreductase [Caulobacter sp.]|nr:molybdopterin-dependent oxidoreductase [Caulobacter sp.]
MRPLILAACLSLLAAPALAQSVALTGPAGQTAMVTARDLAALPRHTVVLDAHGQKNSFDGPLLIDVLARVGAPTGKALRGAELSNAVIVTASDGYQVVIGLAEADPGTRPNKIILADRMDGKPLPEKDGAFRLVVEGDLRPARSARLVTAIKVVKLGEGKPAGHAGH